MKILHALVLLGGLFSAQVACAGPLWGDLGNGTYRNPILWADFNNPCVFRSGATFYLTAATHHFMGMPVLKSRDLVNWTHAGRIYSDLSALSPDFNSPGLAYSAGSQDGEIVEHNGRFHLFNWSTRYRGFTSCAPTPLGPWSPIRKIRDTIGGDYEDPCPFWDDDGQAYLLLVGNPGPLRIFRLNPALDAIVGEGTTLISDIAPKGPQMIKRDGYYYLLVARTGPHKAQFAYRSKSLLGPYEGRLIFEGGKSGMQAAQGSLVPVKGDEWAFVHHEYDMGSVYGRRVYLQPAGWRNGWPWIGADPDGDGVGEPVGLETPAAKPALPPQPIDTANSSDEFVSPDLSPAWMWNHNPAPSAWSLKARPGWLRLNALPLSTRSGFSQYPRVPVVFTEDNLLFAKNTLVQRILGRRSEITTRLDNTRMAPGQRAGLCTMIDDYTWIGVVQEGGTRYIAFGKGNPAKDSVRLERGPELRQKEIWLRLDYHDARGTFSYSLDGSHFMPFGEKDYAYTSSWYEGTKVGLFSYQPSTQPARGSADFDFFRQRHDGAGGGLTEKF